MPRLRGLFLPWVALATVSVLLMLAFPGQETIPYHLGWIALGVAYGIDPWPIRWAFGAVIGYALVTGFVLVVRAVQEVIPFEETAEIPLMATLVILMIWHVNRRLSALAALGRVRRREQRRADRREHMARLVSHEIRTTLTIAGGYLDLVLARNDIAPFRADLDVARDEVSRLNRASERLLRMIRIQESRPLSLVDVDDLMAQTLERWSTVAERSWKLDARAGLVECEPQRLRACLDTLIENSLRYTSSVGTIRIFGFPVDGHVCIGVADSGTGLSEHHLAAINGQPARPDDAEERPHAGTGLGMSLVQDVVLERGGRLAAGRSAEGGALLAMVLPRSPASRPLVPEPAQPRRTVAGGWSQDAPGADLRVAGPSGR